MAIFSRLETLFVDLNNSVVQYQVFEIVTDSVSGNNFTF